MKILNLFKIQFLTYCLFCLLVAPASHAGEIEQNDIVGVWILEKDDAAAEHIEIYEYDGLYFGKIIWLKSAEESSEPLLDVKNKKEELRSRPLLNLEIMKDYKFNGEDTWKDGKFYAHQRGKSVSPKFTLIDANQLKIQVKILFIKKSFTWYRLTDVSQETLQSPDTNLPAGQ